MSRLSIGEAIQQVVGLLANASDTAEVLQAIASSARQMMLADEAYLLLREGRRLVLRAADGLPDGLVGHSFVRVGEGIEGWVADHGEPIALSDAGRERRFRDLPGREGRVRALAVVPMRLRDDVVGVLATAGMDPLQPAGSRLTGLEILASIAAVTMENDRLLGQERRRAHQAEVLLELAGIQDIDLQPFLQRVATAINAALGVDDTELALLDEHATRVVSFARAGGTIDSIEVGAAAWLRPREREWISDILDAGQPVICEDVELDQRLLEEFQGSGVRSLLAVPIQVGGTRRGVLRVATTQAGSFRAEDLAFLTLIATQVGLSVERADLARRQVEVSREQARQQAKQEFLGLVSHELKTPVAVLKAYTELLARKSEIEPARSSDREVLGRMMEQADRMLAMIDQVLDLQRIESGQFSLEIDNFDITETTRRVAESLQVAATNHRMVLQTNGRLVVAADRRRIEQVLVNLMENAVKFSPAGGEITVTVRVHPSEEGRQEAMVAVSDQGIGIASGDLSRIFERFYQGKGRYHRGHVGLGLGLHITREIVERHGGKVWAESMEGQGATFYFTLPVSTVEE